MNKKIWLMLLALLITSGCALGDTQYRVKSNEGIIIANNKSSLINFCKDAEIFILNSEMCNNAWKGTESDPLLIAIDNAASWGQNIYPVKMTISGEKISVINVYAKTFCNNGIGNNNNVCTELADISPNQLFIWKTIPMVVWQIILSILYVSKLLIISFGILFCFAVIVFLGYLLFKKFFNKQE